MKILQVVQFFSPNHGGSARSSYEISKQLQKKGHEVTVLTTDFQITNDFIDSLDGVEVIPFHCQLNIGGLLISSSMNEYLKENIDKFDMIHMHNFRTYQNIVVHYYAKKHGIPYIVQPRGSIPTIRKSKQKKLFDMLFGHAIIKDARKIIASSKIESNQFWDVFPDLNNEIVVHIPNGINLETYQNLPIKGKFKKRYSINTNEKIILFLSRIHERKGADGLIEAFSGLKNKLENVKLVIAGPDEGYLDNLKSIVSKLDIEEKVIFPGPLYEKDKLEAYVDADVFVLPSKDRYESFGNVVLEACACGTPVIVTNNCGISEWITDDVGYVVEYDKDQITNAIYEILVNAELSSSYKRNRKDFINYFIWDDIVTKIENAYLECL